MLFVVTCCWDLLGVVGWSLKLVKLQSQQAPTFLLFRGHRSVVQQCCARLHSTSNNVAPAHAHQRVVCMELWVFVSQTPLYSHLKTQHVLTCCERLHTSANIVQQETTLLAPSMFRVVASVFTGLNTTALASFRGRWQIAIQSIFWSDGGRYRQQTNLTCRLLNKEDR